MCQLFAILFLLEGFLPGAVDLRWPLLLSVRSPPIPRAMSLYNARRQSQDPIPDYRPDLSFFLQLPSEASARSDENFLPLHCHLPAGVCSSGFAAADDNAAGAGGHPGSASLCTRGPRSVEFECRAVDEDTEIFRELSKQESEAAIRSHRGRSFSKQRREIYLFEDHPGIR